MSGYKSYKDIPGYRPMIRFAETKKNPGDYVFDIGGGCSIVQPDGKYMAADR